MPNPVSISSSLYISEGPLVLYTSMKTIVWIKKNIHTYHNLYIHTLFISIIKINRLRLDYNTQYKMLWVDTDHNERKLWKERHFQKHLYIHDTTRVYTAHCYLSFGDCNIINSVPYQNFKFATPAPITWQWIQVFQQ